MPAAQDKYDLVALAPRQSELAGFTKALELAMGSGNLIQGCRLGTLRVIASAILTIECCDRFD